MSFFKRIFGKRKDQDAEKDLPWINPAENPWNVKLLDLRPISQTMISTSSDPQMARNAISYSGDDGTAFWGIKPANPKTISTNISIPIDGSLEPGVLFIPTTMEHKWAINFDGENLIFIRSWLRQVFVTAKTVQKNNQLIIENITGEFTENESLDFTTAVLNFLLLSHPMGQVVPAPLPLHLESNTRDAGHWAFSYYGNMAHVGTFDHSFIPVSENKLRSHSLLHIAVAKSDIDQIERLVKNGSNVNLLAGDGLATLHWSIACEDTESMKKLFELGADPNIMSIQGATPLMNATQFKKTEHLRLLIESGAFVNARDNRGFTALHRAAGMGEIEIVKLLLSNGADKTIEAKSHTALSLAIERNYKDIIELLK